MPNYARHVPFAWETDAVPGTIQLAWYEHTS